MAPSHCHASGVFAKTLVGRGSGDPTCCAAPKRCVWGKRPVLHASLRQERCIEIARHAPWQVRHDSSLAACLSLGDKPEARKGAPQTHHHVTPDLLGVIQDNVFAKPCVSQEPLNAPALNELFSRGFSRAKTAH